MLNNCTCIQFFNSLSLILFFPMRIHCIRPFDQTSLMTQRPGGFINVALTANGIVFKPSDRQQAANVNQSMKRPGSIQPSEGTRKCFRNLSIFLVKAAVKAVRPGDTAPQRPACAERGLALRLPPRLRCGPAQT